MVPRLPVVAAVLTTAAACGPHLRTCADGCGEGAYCDTPSQLCVALLEDGGRFVEQRDAGQDDGPPRTCLPGQRRPCAPGCGATETCTAAGEWGACSAPDCGAGTVCLADRCVCSPATCAGCCLNGVECRPGTERYACGAGGEACVGCGTGHCLPVDQVNRCI